MGILRRPAMKTLLLVFLAVAFAEPEADPEADAYLSRIRRNGGCYLPVQRKKDFNCKKVHGTFPYPWDCGQSFVQCPNPQGGKTGQPITCGPGSWFDPDVCNCSPGYPDCSAIYAESRIRLTPRPITNAYPPRRPTQPSRPNGCQYTDCSDVDPRDSVTTFPDDRNAYGFIQCSHGRPIRQQCNGIPFNWNTCTC